MKIKMLSRNPSEYRRETTDEILKVPRNRRPDLHPFAAEREYVRAFQATKLERVFAKPFIGVLEGTTDSVSVITLNPNALSLALFGTADGKMQYWNIARRKIISETKAHDGDIRGICYDNENVIYSTGVDGMLKQWQVASESNIDWSEPVNSVLLKSPALCMDHHPQTDQFCIGNSECLSLYISSRLDDPVKEWTWGVDAIISAKFNRVDPNIIAALAKDNSLRLFDIRQDNPLKKIKMQLRMNSLSWNPMEAYIFTTACEDYNLYSYDVRKFDTPCMLYRGHTNAVMDVDYSPTGQEVVSASYDQSVRIWRVDDNSSRDIYHTKRMKRVYLSKFSLDSKYILTSSSDQNVRLWKANASEKLQPMQVREKVAIAEAEALKTKFKEHPEIRRILKHRHVPKHIYTATQEIKVIRAKERRKQRNINRHSVPGTVQQVKEKDKHTIAVYE